MGTRCWGGKGMITSIVRDLGISLLIGLAVGLPLAWVIFR